MGKNKLRKFAEMETFPNVFQCTATDTRDTSQPYFMAGKWNKDFFHNQAPITLELGCGRGEYTVGLGDTEPDRNFIGIDIKGARIWAGAKQAFENNMPNVAFLRTNIEFLPRFFAENEVDEIWITFPDPQMKKASKRLTSTFFLNRYRRILKDGGIVHLKTDSPFLFTYTSELVKLNKLEVICQTDNLYAESSMKNNTATAIQTHYERQWIERGMTIKYLSFRLNRHTTLNEPEIEIEKDNYRSYGRNYNISKQTIQPI